MSDSKWINRNMRAGSSPKGIPGATPTFRREHGQKKSSRPIHRKSRRSRRTHNKKIGGRIFFLAIIIACLVVAGVLAFYTRTHRSVTAGTSWIPMLSNPFAEDTGLEPIAHNPSELVEAFLAATSTDDLAALSRTDDNSREILDQHGEQILKWIRDHRDWIPMHEAKANGLMFTVFGVAHAEKRPRPIYVIQTAEGPKIDIGAFLAWSSEDWENLTSGKATGASVVRASATRISYYNYNFKDEAAYHSYRLDPLTPGPSIYGYALRGSATDSVLDRLIGEELSCPVVVSLEGGVEGSDHRQFRISQVIAVGWAMGPEIIEEHLPRLTSDPKLLAPLDITISDLSAPRGQDDE